MRSGVAAFCEGAAAPPKVQRNGTSRPVIAEINLQHGYSAQQVSFVATASESISVSREDSLTMLRF